MDECESCQRCHLFRHGTEKVDDLRFIELQAHHSVQLTYCTRSTDTLMDLCVRWRVLDTSRPMLLTLLDGDHLHVWY